MPNRSTPSQHKVAVCNKCEAATHHIVTQRHLDGAHFERIVKNNNPWYGRWTFGPALVCLKCATATPH